jgi:hypothetical protein
VLLDVISLHDRQIAEVAAFPTPDLFWHFGLPDQLLP